MTLRTYSERLKRCGQLMKAEGLNVLLLTKPSNMFYLTGDGQVLKSFGVPMSHLDLGRILPMGFQRFVNYKLAIWS
jgi:Xaa-Pro aminopeptidase